MDCCGALDDDPELADVSKSSIRPPRPFTAPDGGHTSIVLHIAQQKCGATYNGCDNFVQIGRTR